MKRILITLLLVVLSVTGCAPKEEVHEEAQSGIETHAAQIGIVNMSEEKLYTLNGEDGYFTLPENYTLLPEEKIKEEMEKNLVDLIERQKAGEPIIWEAKAITGIADQFPRIFDQMKNEGLLDEGNVQITPEQ